MFLYILLFSILLAALSAQQSRKQKLKQIDGLNKLGGLGGKGERSQKSIKAQILEYVIPKTRLTKQQTRDIMPKEAHLQR